MADAYIGEIRMFAGNFAIAQWEMCNGQLMSIAQNQALFSIIGTYYGGNGVQTFALPNFQGRVPIHQGTGLGLPTYTIGEAAGTNQVTLLTQNLPQHNHATFVNPTTTGITIQGGTGTANAATPTGNYLAGKTTGTSGLNSGDLYCSTPGTAGALNAGSLNIPSGLSTGLTGGNIPVSVVQPYLTVTFLICMYGIFPSRN